MGSLTLSLHYKGWSNIMDRFDNPYTINISVAGWSGGRQQAFGDQKVGKWTDLEWSFVRIEGGSVG